MKAETRKISLVLILVFLPAQVGAQETMPTSGGPDAACLAELDAVQLALDEEDAGRAMVLLDMATEACVAARQELVDRMGEDPLGAGLASTEALWRMELRRIELLRGMEECEDARRALIRLSADAELPASLELVFARAAHSTLRCGPSPGSATGGTVTMGAGFPDATMNGHTVGEIAASTLGDNCWGNIPTDPNYTLEVMGDSQLSIYAYSMSGNDLVLAVTGPSGTFCNDDWDGLDPGLTEYFTTGTYAVYIGEYSVGGGGSDFSITFSTTSLISSYIYPTYGSAYLGSGYGRTTLSGSVWGVNDASVTFDATCSGWVAENPDFQMTMEGAGEAWVTVTGAVGTDLTLVIDGPGGRQCRDDDSGANPVFNGELGPGTYNVWIGDKAGVSTGASYGIQFSPYDPMTILETEPSYGIATLSSTSEPVILSGKTEAALPASDFFGSSCYGTIGTAPSHRLVLTEDASVEIVSRATYSGDLVIAVSGPEGTFCSDDYDGLNPGVRQWLTTGEYVVYVGPLGSYAGEIDFQTTFAIVEGGPPFVLGGSASGLFGNATVGSGYDSETMSGTSGGPLAAATMESTCTGYVTEEPSFVLDVTGGGTISIQAMSEGDTTLVIVGPDGTICNDDNVGVNPGVEQYLSPGRHGVWVGSYAAGDAFPFMITFRSYYY